MTFCWPAEQALAALFMMNNEHFMVKTVEGSEALMLLGPDWLERRKDKVRQALTLTPTSTLTPTQNPTSNPILTKTLWKRNLVCSDAAEFCMLTEFGSQHEHSADCLADVTLSLLPYVSAPGLHHALQP